MSRSFKDKKPEQKKVAKTLESWVQGPSKKTERPAPKTKSLKKRVSEDTQQSKEGFKDIRSWFERKGLAQEEVKEHKDQKQDPGKEPKDKEPSGGKAK